VKLMALAGPTWTLSVMKPGCTTLEGCATLAVDLQRSTTKFEVVPLYLPFVPCGTKFLIVYCVYPITAAWYVS